MGCFFYGRLENVIFIRRYESHLERMLLKLASKKALKSLKKISQPELDDDYEVHTLLQHTEVERFIVCLFSFSRFLTKTPKVIVSDDGSLTLFDKHQLQSVYGVQVVDCCEIQNKFELFFKGNEILKRYRQEAIRTRKVIDVLFLNTKSKKILLLDSDVGFFSEPKEVIQFLNRSEKKEKMIFMSDIQDAYATSRVNLKKIFKKEVEMKLNCGLLAFERKFLTKQFVIDIFNLLNTHEHSYQYKEYWIDQTPWAILAKRYASKRLSTDYLISMEKTPKNVICRHYVHGSRYFFIKDLVYLLTS